MMTLGGSTNIPVSVVPFISRSLDLPVENLKTGLHMAFLKRRGYSLQFYSLYCIFLNSKKACVSWTFQSVHKMFRVRRVPCYM